MIIYMIFIMFQGNKFIITKNSSRISREELCSLYYAIIFLLCKNEQEIQSINHYHVLGHYVIFHIQLHSQSQGNRYHEISLYHNYIGIPNKIHYENL